jgi:hypothetical protein
MWHNGTFGAKSYRGALIVSTGFDRRCLFALEIFEIPSALTKAP